MKHSVCYEMTHSFPILSTRVLGREEERRLRSSNTKTHFKGNYSNFQVTTKEVSPSGCVTREVLEYEVPRVFGQYQSLRIKSVLVS